MLEVGSHPLIISITSAMVVVQKICYDIRGQNPSTIADLWEFRGFNDKKKIKNIGGIVHILELCQLAYYN